MADSQWWHMTDEEIDEGIAFVGCWIASGGDELTEKALKILQRALLSLRAERAKVKRLREALGEALEIPSEFMGWYCEACKHDINIGDHDEDCIFTVVRKALAETEDA